MLTTKKIYITSESGDRIAERENVQFSKGKAKGTVLTVNPDSVKTDNGRHRVIFHRIVSLRSIRS